MRVLVLLTIPILFVFGKYDMPTKMPQLVKKVEEKLDPRPTRSIDLKHYRLVLSSINKRRNDLAKMELTDSIINVASDQWTSFMTDSIFPYWYGTEWDFNGHTDKPNNGQIACGYFVSTTMRHSGIALNRYKLAQKAASDIIDNVCAKGSAKWFDDLDALTDHLNGRKDGLFVLGLDYHVGFVLREGEDHFFIHSDYFNGKVTKELLTNSTAANSTSRYYLGSISENKDLMKCWLTGKVVSTK